MVRVVVISIKTTKLSSRITTGQNVKGITNNSKIRATIKN